MFRVLQNQFLDKVDRLRGHALGIGHCFYLAVYDLPHCFLPTDVIERSLSCQQFESEDSQTPQVDTHVIVFSF